MIPKVIINADGGSRGNPGPAAIGILIRDTNRTIAKFSQIIGMATNNVAEYKALVKALELASKFTKEEVYIFMDSELVVRQLSGDYRVKANNLKPIFERVRKLESMFRKVTYRNVTRDDKFQAQADFLVNQALDRK
jgi:ribonuclease HI